MSTLYQQLGFLILGSRLRRMSEYFLAEVSKVYEGLEIPFEPSWFPLFYILVRDQKASIRQVADELMTSHSAISQLVTKLKERELIVTLLSPSDKRIQLIGLSKKGEQLSLLLKPVWERISQSMTAMEKEDPEVAHFLSALTHLERHFERNALSDLIMKDIQKS